MTQEPTQAAPPALTAGIPLAEQIIASHLVGEEGPVSPGRLVTVRPDRVYVQDGNAPTIAKLYQRHGYTTVFAPERVSFVFDHSVLVADVDMADRMKEAEAFAAEIGVDVRRRGQGISHVIAAELGWFAPGTLVLGSDSHTCVGGAFGSLGLGMGASDITAAMVTGSTWLRVPESVVVRFTGTPERATQPRDVLLTLLNRMGQEPFLYCSVEFEGPWARALTSDASASLASLGVELGAKCVFVPDEQGTVPAGTATGLRTVEFDIGGLQPVVSLPHLPAHTAQLDEAAGTPIDYVFLGSCTNSRLEDIAQAAATVKGHQVSTRTQFVITPGSMGVYREAMHAGYIDTLIDAGAVVTPPGCGTCVGTQGPLPARGDNVLSTMNRNFRGRMGNAEANIYLSSPAVAAATALLGAIPTVKEIP
ncbi:aconitase family protein [Streptomyces sp. NBC_01221]|uniref:3-isopropylmalate dehydratase large subunit n=1 Tax=unclassified Streptomyces TaxID=2593676 RepID=UPI00224CF7CE|nr:MULTISPECIES: aconitase family protein [unclassified Streptomyces]WSP57218.1 aconitase family protein [Streptomyces sp. NBC_01241]WSU22064.1 aconitase family protein [Streptomyces sp. NBC_01108]MCX4789030.1 aconitase family protein [Streptomyces sp. NBC_01221]MCX4795224.1 aconitase family protein [Streptomyces sp. NBC_01242]WSJ36537.1 aconitase family protein [Streptomyces sp. NBC_01321]